MFRWITPVFFLCACSQGGSNGETAGEVIEAPEDELHLHAEELESWGIRPGRIETTLVSAELTLPGALTVNENRTASVAPLVSGQISQLRVDLGSRVGAGQVLVTRSMQTLSIAERFASTSALAYVSVVFTSACPRKSRI